MIGVIRHLNGESTGVQLIADETKVGIRERAEAARIVCQRMYKSGVCSKGDVCVAYDPATDRIKIQDGTPLKVQMEASESLQWMRAFGFFYEEPGEAQRVSG